MGRLRKTLAILLLTCASAHAGSDGHAVSLDEYAKRLDECAAAIRMATGPDSTGERIIAGLRTCERELADLRVSFPGGTVEVENDWVESLSRLARDDVTSVTAVRREVLTRLEAIRREVSQPVALGPPPDAEDVLARVLARDEFAFRGARADSGWIEWLRRKAEEMLEAAAQFIERVLEPIIEWLRDWLGFLVPDAGGGTGTSLGRALLFVLGAVMLAFLAYALARMVLASHRRLTRKDSTEEEEIIELPRPDELISRAVSLGERGEWRQGIRFFYLAVLAFLEEQGLVRYDRSKTNWEYAREIGPSFADRDRFLGLTRSFDRVWYGMQVATAEDYAGFHADLEAITGRGGKD